MEKYMNILENLLSLKDEYEWLDFKENWFSKDEIGEYISAISNGAALCGKESGYIVWGIKDKTREIAGTTINLDKDIDGEPNQSLKIDMLDLINRDIFDFVRNDSSFEEMVKELKKMCS